MKKNMEKNKSAVDWLVEQLARKHNEFQALTFYYDHKEEIEQAKQMEKEQEYETKAFWFGRGILAGKENRIEELKPIKDNGKQ
jgi:hypothetical protein